ncbi:MAG: PqqD family protein [Desulfobacteraceae bacterium]|jgi:hypothetical protein
MIIHQDSIYDKSDQVIAREIENEFIIVSIATTKEGSLDKLYFLNETGRELWEHLNGKTNVNQLIQIISRQYRKDFHEQIRKDINSLIKELLAHNIIIKVG